MGEIPWTADQVEAIFHHSLGAGDIQGVDAALRVMLRLDVDRACDLYEDLKAAVRVAKGIRPLAPADNSGEADSG